VALRLFQMEYQWRPILGTNGGQCRDIWIRSYGMVTFSPQVGAAIAACYPRRVIQRSKASGFFGMALLLAVALIACHKEEQAVVGVAQNAVNAEHQAQAAAQASATEREQQRAQLARIPLPTKSMYVDVHEPGAWANPFLSVDTGMLTLRVTMADANPSSVGQGTMLRPEAARRQEIQLRPGDLAAALIALPPGAWRYGRVIAVAESPLANRKDRPKVRRNVEAAIQLLNDLGIVVEEWPTR
jgi:hypothetical protein